jgi:hypothetical protein
MLPQKLQPGFILKYKIIKVAEMRLFLLCKKRENVDKLSQMEYRLNGNKFAGF